MTGVCFAWLTTYVYVARCPLDRGASGRLVCARLAGQHHRAVRLDGHRQARLRNTDMRAAMAAAMRFWLNRGIDGFRCDMACEVPIDLWQQTLPALRKEYPGHLPARRGRSPRIARRAFDASYAWELHHLLNDIAQGTQKRRRPACLRRQRLRCHAARGVPPNVHLEPRRKLVGRDGIRAHGRRGTA